MIQMIKQTITYLKWDWPTLLLFELLHKLFALVVIIPLFFSILTSMMLKADLTYLSPSIINRFIFSPSTLILGLSMILLLGYYFFFELSAIFLYYQSAVYKQHLSIFYLIKQSVLSSLKILLPKNLLLLMVLIFFIPATTFSFKTICLDGASITEFLFDFIYQRAPLHPLYLMFILILEVIFIRLIFILPLFIYKKRSFMKACQESLKLTKGCPRYLIPLLISWSLFAAVIFMVIYGVLILVVAILTKIMTPSSKELMIFYDASFTIKNILIIIVPSFMIIGNCGFITTIYTLLPFNHFDESISSYTSNHRHPILISLAILSLSLCVGEFISPDNLYSKNEHLSDEIKIIAHRASATQVPENTLSALDYAILSGADIAEIDVQQTKDGELILMHDSNLKRTTGYDSKVSEATFEQIRALESGSWFSDEFLGEPIPTLEDVLQKSKGEITLMIEIKASDHPVDVARDVIKLIESYEMEKQCIVGAMDYRVLQAVKMMNPRIKTVYITALAYGDYQDLEDVDYYSIEASFISFALIDQIHRSGKQIYAWTVNKDSTMQSMIAMQVDGIVTDDPVLLQSQLTQINDHYVSFVGNLFFSKQ